MFEQNHFETGVNYWASSTATEMWRKWDAEVVERDFAELEKYGVTIARVFPLWPDFQPIKSLSCAGLCIPVEMRRADTEERFPETEAGKAGVDETMMARFEMLCDIAEKHHIKLIVCILTAHMTFRLFLPPAMENRDLFLDPKALKWEGKFFRYFVRRMKHHPAIRAWESGNESNFISKSQDADTAWFWQNYVYSIIRNEDSTRPIIAVSDLKIDNGEWLIRDGAELGDVLAVHPYPMWGNAGIEEFNHIRNLMFSAALNRINQDIGGCECFIEETGCQREIATDTAHIALAARNMLWNAWAENAHAFVWWCAFDQRKLDTAPYSWPLPALEHGILEEDYTPRPIALEMKKFVDFLKTLPFDRLPDVRRDALCLTNDMEIAQSAFIMARQANINLQFAAPQLQTIPRADFYMLPSVKAKGALSTQCWEDLKARIRDGASLYLSLNDCYLTDLEEVCGLSVLSRKVQNGTGKYDFAGHTMTLPRDIFRTLKLAGAEVLARDADGNPCFCRYQYGQGTVYTLSFAVEKLLYGTPGYFEAGAWKIYRQLFDKDYLLDTDHPALSATEHCFTDQSAAVVVVNSGMAEVKFTPKIRAGWHIQSILGDAVCQDQNITLGQNSGCVVMMRQN